MQGFQVIGYIGADEDSEQDEPKSPKEIIKKWAPTNKAAEKLRNKMQEEHDGVFRIRG